MMKQKLLAGIGSGLLTSLAIVAALSISVGAATPVEDAVTADGPDRVALCHLQKKVDESLLFNDGRVITASKASCAAHCRHGDHPMPVPADNNAHPNRACARIQFQDGLPSCEVNTPNNNACSVEACIARCMAS